MYRQLARPPYQSAPEGWDTRTPEIARSGGLDALIALERIGARLRFSRDQEIHAAEERDGCWYRVISGAARLCPFSLKFRNARTEAGNSRCRWRAATSPTISA